MRQLQFIFEKIVLNESKLANGHYRITGEAIHPCMTYHPQEWFKVRQYIEPYLERAAPTLAGKPLVIDHERKLPKENSLNRAYWDPASSSVRFEGEITEDVYNMFKNGVLKYQVSVGADWVHPGGGIVIGSEGQVIPYAFDFSELSFLSQGMNMQSGDPLSNVQLWEGLCESIRAAKNPKPTKRYVVNASGDIFAEDIQP